MDGFEQRCSVAPDGHHCFHGDTQRTHIEVCCWCGKQHIPVGLEHGSYAPDAKREFDEVAR